jgi:Transglutaminase-like superfamily
MRIRGVPVAPLLQAIALAAVRPRPRLAGLISDTEGRQHLTDEERRLALGAESALRHLGVRCLRRSVVVAGMLRRRGVAARIRISISHGEPREAHAEVEVGGVPLRRPAPGWAVLR